MLLFCVADVHMYMHPALMLSPVDGPAPVLASPYLELLFI